MLDSGSYGTNYYSRGWMDCGVSDFRTLVLGRLDFKSAEISLEGARYKFILKVPDTNLF